MQVRSREMYRVKGASKNRRREPMQSQCQITKTFFESDIHGQKHNPARRYIRFKPGKKTFRRARREHSVRFFACKNPKNLPLSQRGRGGWTCSQEVRKELRRVCFRNVKFDQRRGVPIVHRLDAVATVFVKNLFGR